ncbi:hypothetical protein POVWA2_018070 [Plasmodium ovale wallikeri]|uniref:Uncharacterized protein n=1 Tax=Plasmodium ovale wallikeri TaxID=864142 RepID=A0A1A8YR29_PLAOA|nr:hypothetical protein POVWA1_018180 [Plasmodium ovale wallikeri]SBT34077.1 hypothetical protein POVWA2_018070 [Plasmodium ovale wallikeri]
MYFLAAPQVGNQESGQSGKRLIRKAVKQESVRQISSKANTQSGKYPVRQTCTLVRVDRQVDRQTDRVHALCTDKAVQT